MGNAHRGGESKCLNGNKRVCGYFLEGEECMGRWCVGAGMRCKKRRGMCGRKCVGESVWREEISRERFVVRKNNSLP